MKSVTTLIFLTFLLTVYTQDILFQTTVYPETEQLAENSAEFIYGGKSLLASVTVFSSGKIVLVGDEDNYLVPGIEGPLKVYETSVDETAIANFLEFLHQDGFLDLPDYAKGDDKSGLICDHFTHEGIDHEVCRPVGSTHEIIDSIDREIEELITAGRHSVVDFVPLRVHTEKVPVDLSTCSTVHIQSSSWMHENYGKHFARSQFQTGSHAIAFWNDMMTRSCFSVDGDIFAYIVATDYISAFFDFEEPTPVPSPTPSPTPTPGPGPVPDPQPPIMDDDDNYDCDEDEYCYDDDVYNGDDYSFNPTFIIIGAVAFIVFLIIIGSVRRARNNRSTNASVEVVDPNNFNQTMQPGDQQAAYLYTTQPQQPAFYVQQTNTGPVYYATNTNTTPGMPNNVIYTVNQ